MKGGKGRGTRRSADEHGAGLFTDGWIGMARDGWIRARVYPKLYEHRLERRDGEMACVGRKGRSAREATERPQEGTRIRELTARRSAVREPEARDATSRSNLERVFTILSTRSRSVAVVIVRVSASRCSMCTESDGPGISILSTFHCFPPQASAPLWSRLA